jgi:hypothetical protein
MLLFERRKSLDKERKLVRIEIHTDREVPTEWEKRKTRKTERARNVAVRREDPQNQKAEVPDTKAADQMAGVAQASEDAEKVEMKIHRICPNPRLVECTYVEEGEERRCIVRVGRNGHFVRGMKLRLLEPSDPSAQSEPWPYTGPLPRRRGCW